VEAAAGLIEQKLGPIDVWVNNAAVTLFGRAEKVSPAELRRVSDVTYHGAVWGTMAALKYMRPRGRGTIVQVGSGAAYRGIPLQSAYSAAKHALRGFTDSLRVELLRDRVNVHLTMVNPSAINTPLYTWARNLMPRHARPMPPVYQPEVVAATIYWAAQARRRDLHLGWTAIGAAVLNPIVPGLVDLVLAQVGFEAQQVEGVPPAPYDNLFDPVEGDFGAHGLFGDRAMSPALLAQFLARWGGGGIRAAIVAAMSLIDER
jgi:short-subunit dehydrogenase